jgi:hypothetical protein
MLAQSCALHGWDANGQSTRERMEEMGEMYGEMVEAPAQAKGDR